VAKENENEGGKWRRKWQLASAEKYRRQQNGKSDNEISAKMKINGSGDECENDENEIINGE
jgi:hypothetical protein